MELARNVTLGQYVPGESPVHMLDPRAKIVGWIILAVGMFLSGSFLGLAVVGGFTILLLFWSGLPVAYVLRGYRPMLPFLVVIYLFQLLFSGTLYPDSTHVLYQWGIFEVTREGVVASTLVIIRVLVLLLSVNILTLTTSLVLLVDGAERLSAPLRRVGIPHQELAMVSAIAVRFVPTLIEEAEKLIKAQTARGARIESGNVWQRTRARIPVLIPLFLGTFRRAGDLVTAMESRCYRGGKGRTKRRRLHMRAADWLGLALVTAVALIGFALASSSLP